MERLKPEQFSLKTITKKRILKDMIEGVKIQNPLISHFILVVDKYSVKVLSKAVTMSELVREGI